MNGRFWNLFYLSGAKNQFDYIRHQTAINGNKFYNCSQSRQMPIVFPIKRNCRLWTRDE